MKRARTALLMSLALMAATGVNAGDAAAGAKVFAAECSECHSVHEGKDKKGPSLFGIVDAKAAQRAGFAYSDSLRASAIVWSRDNLTAYIANPKKLVPGGKMKYDGLADAKQREDLVSYLETPTKR